jgi:hypothetical protein
MALSAPHNHRVDLIRYFGGDDKCTIGVLLLDQRALSFTLEDQFRTEKLKGRTRIPAGLYELELKKIGTSRFDIRGWNQAPLRYYGMIRVKDVPGFEEILIHPGNTDADTEGCILVGLGSNLVAGQIMGSAPAYVKVYQPIADLLKKGEPVSILIQDKDRLDGSRVLVA